MSDFYTVKGEDLSNLANDLREASGQNGQLNWPNGFRSAAQTSGQNSLPTDGTIGQVLQKTASGAEWADKDLYIVHYNRYWDTANNQPGQWVCDKSHDEIIAARNDGKNISAIVAAQNANPEEDAGIDDITTNYIQLPFIVDIFGILIYGVSTAPDITGDIFKISFVLIHQPDGTITLRNVNEPYISLPSSDDVGKVPVVNDVDGNVVWKDNPTGDFIVATYTEHGSDEQHTDNYWTCDKTYTEINDAHEKIIGVVKGIDIAFSAIGHMGVFNGKPCYEYSILLSDVLLCTIKHMRDDTIITDYHPIVKTVGGNAPDNSGNVSIDDSLYVKSINNITPDPVTGNIAFGVADISGLADIPEPTVGEAGYVPTVVVDDESQNISIKWAEQSLSNKVVTDIQMMDGLNDVSIYYSDDSVQHLALNSNEVVGRITGEMATLFFTFIKQATANPNTPIRYRFISAATAVSLMGKCRSCFVDGMTPSIIISKDNTILILVSIGATVNMSLLQPNGCATFKGIMSINPADGDGVIEYTLSVDFSSGTFFLTIVNYTGYEPLPGGDEHTMTEVVEEIRLSLEAISYTDLKEAMTSRNDFSLSYATAGWDSSGTTSGFNVTPVTDTEATIMYDSINYKYKLTWKDEAETFSIDSIIYPD